MIINIVEISLAKHGLNFEKYVELNTQFKITLKNACLAAHFTTSGYLVNGLSVIRGTVIPADRWEQLIRNGVKHFNSQQDSLEELDNANTILIKPNHEVTRSLQSSRSLLTELRQLVYSRRQDKKISFKERTESFENLLSIAKDAAPIVFYVCAWIYSLHKKKLALSTQYNYLNRIGFDLFQAIGNDPIDEEHVDVLRSAYNNVFDSAASPDDRAYKLVLLKQFHNFMVSTIGIPKIEFGIEGYEFPKQSNADANFISETEFRCIANTLKASDVSELGLARYWIFVLGYRVGLRASEAVSIQLKDIQRTYHMVQGTDLTLLVRPNQYVNIKSSDARRQLPLHLLLTLEERQEFEHYVRERSEILGVQSKMLFSSDGMSLRPIEDADIFSTDS
ncbi:MAG: hypothetical protein LRY63_03060 [Nitrincola sp.]|nr:hypothetical protein [Nitrincola sp.]